MSNNCRGKILLVDDEQSNLDALRKILKIEAYETLEARDGNAALRLFQSMGADLIITDYRMPGMNGMELLKAVRGLNSAVPVIMVTAFGSVDDAVEAMKLGAIDFLGKPISRKSLLKVVQDSLVRKKHVKVNSPKEDLVGQCSQIAQIRKTIYMVAPTKASVFIEGESGTGKERIATALHAHSTRSQGPFVAISCAALPETLLEAELFGYEKGAFTDARKERRGRFELAHGGTIFLDDIDDMPLPVQVKLLRVLQERNFERLGSEITREIDIRVVAATKVPLRKHASDGLFREDLFYRINVVPIQLPKLSDRVGDVPLLAQHFVERFGGGRPYKFSRATMARLERYPWPGNVRELENAVQRAVALAGDRNELAAEDLLPGDARWRGATEVPEEILPLKDVVADAEMAHIERALHACGGHRSQTADLLGISRKVLWEKLRGTEWATPSE